MMRKIYISLFVLTGFMHARAQVSVQDSLALVSLYYATDGPNWKNNTNWLQGPVSTWHGVSLQGDRVYLLNLYDNGLNGYIPESIGQLTAIVELYLRKSTFTGGIPDVFGQMSELSQLNLSECGLTGEIPSSLGDCPKLARLNVSKNQLTGSIPPSLESCPDMIYLLVGQNNLTGPFPEVIRSWQGLEQLDLSQNSFSGSIPNWIAELDQLYWLFLEEIPFDGPMPFIGDKPNLTHLYITHNQVTGNLEDILGNYPSLQYFFIEQTNLSGRLSPEHFNPQQVVRLTVRHTEIDELGDFTDWSNYPNFIQMIISNNRLDFDDLVPNSTMPSQKMLCSPQKPIGMDTVVTLFPGEEYAIYSPMQDEDIEYQWYFNQMLIEGLENYDLTLPPFTPELAGDFQYTATHPSFPGVLIESAVTTLVEGTTSLNALNSSSLHVFPNPATDFIVLESTHALPIMQLQLYTADGQLLLNIHSQQPETIVSLEAYAAGIYFLKWATSGQSGFEKIVKR